jgi:hypothetical protein
VSVPAPREITCFVCFFSLGLGIGSERKASMSWSSAVVRA